MMLLEISSNVQAQLLAQRLRNESLEACLARLIGASYEALKEAQEEKAREP